MPNTHGEVVDAIRTAFPASDAATILAVLDVYGTEPHEQERERVQLAIVALSQGSEDKLLYFVQVAKTDFRDILCWQTTGPLTPEEGEQLQDDARRLVERWGKK